MLKRTVLLGLALAALASNTHAMTMRVVESDANTSAIFATGEILPGDAEEFQRLARSQTGKEVIFFITSSGGRVVEAQKLADQIKRWRIPVVAVDLCTSSCFLVLAGSPERFMVSGTQIGVHSASSDNGESTLSMAVTTAMARAASEYGVPASIVGRMVTTRPSEMAWLTPAEIRSMNITVFEERRRPALPPIAAAPTQPIPTTPPAAAVSASFQRGLADRTAYETWYNSLSGDSRAGALFWAGTRSRERYPCRQEDGRDFYAGCEEAKRRLTPTDVLRQSDPEYRRGWNSYPAPVVARPAISAAPTPAPQNYRVNSNTIRRAIPNVLTRYQQAGIAGLKVSWNECVQVVSRNQNSNSAEYCIILIIAGFLIDRAMNNGASSPGWTSEVVTQATWNLFSVMNVAETQRPDAARAYMAAIQQALLSQRN